MLLKMVKIRGTIIDETYAEAFRMRYTRLVVTAHDAYWLSAAVAAVTGYGASVIGCDAEVGVEQYLADTATPDGRPGAAILAFAFSTEAVAKAIANRTGQCLMTCPTTAVYDGLPESTERVPLGKRIRYFGDGFQKSKQLDGRRFWRVPVMDGEFLVEESVGVAKGIAGGNVIVQAARLEAALAATRRGCDAIADLRGVITPFPGGVARSGSKVGSRYKGLVGSTADAYCPTLRGRVTTQLHEGVSCAYEIVIDGVDQETVARAMGTAIQAAVGDEVVAIAAGNYGGKLGKFHFRLHDLL
jgi:formylmethanofuran--tetrahydromethanopterin N-formyltransferase